MMPDTRTIRMNTIADDLEDDGMYTRATSVRAIVWERDQMLEALKEIAGDPTGVSIAQAGIAKIVLAEIENMRDGKENIKRRHGAGCDYPNCDCPVEFPLGCKPSVETECPRVAAAAGDR